jgi:hypothetical protein
MPFSENAFQEIKDSGARNIITRSITHESNQIDISDLLSL